MPDPGPLTILVVDDDEAKRYTIAHVLRRAGFLTREAATGEEGLRMAAEGPDLIVLDVKLPDIDGFEVCRRIKADPATASIPVLQLSATFVSTDDRVQGLDSGADGYLTQIVEPPELLATVRALIRARKAEEETRLLALQWQTTFDAISDGVGLLGLDGVVVRCNRSFGRALGAAGPEAVVGRDIHDLLPFLPGKGEGSPFRRMRETRRSESDDLTRGARWLQVLVDPILGDREAIVGAVCVVSDITDRKLLEEELRRRAEALAQADQRKDEFLAMLAHELRNPLAPILNALEVIRLDHTRGPDFERAREIAGRQVRHMARLIDDLLDVARITRGAIELREEPVDLNGVIAHAVEGTRPFVESRNHQLAVQSPLGAVWLRGDPARLEQVFANLLNNAAKYTEPGGAISLVAEREGDEVVIRVSDNGVGIAPEMLPRIFDLFAQADRSLDRAQGGLGIGLTLVRSLVEMHRGTIRAGSPGLGQGSEFVVRLPVAKESLAEGPKESLAAGPAATDRPEAPAGRPLQIVVVDDHVDSAKSLARLLTFWGHRVCTAHTGQDAIEAVRRVPTDLVLLDLGLPGMNGFEVAREIRGADKPAEPLLVALTGYGQEDDRRRTREAGFDLHLVKPLDPDILQHLIASAARGAT
jgi:PAS domain S-box-containing protein